MMNTKIEILRLPHGKDIALPEYKTIGSAGMDVRAAVDSDINIPPGERVLIPTGFAIALIPGLEAQIRPRSGLALKHGIMIVNSPGTIDSDYRGEIKIILYNAGTEPFTIKRGDRIAQMVIAEYTRIDWNATDELPETERNSGGFGHTGSS